MMTNSNNDWVCQKRPFGKLGIDISASELALALQKVISALRNFFGKIGHLCPLHLNIFPCA